MDGMHCIGKIKVKSDKGTLDLDVTNTVTQLFEEIVAHEGIDGIFGLASPMEGGQTFILSNAGNKYSGAVYFGNNNASGADFQITVYLLNLQDSEKNGLNSKSNVLPVYTSALNAIDNDKIVGYATVKVAATKTKEGYLIPLEGETLVSHRRHGLQWKWEPGVLSGSFNAICVGVNVLNDDNIYSGVMLQHAVENNNTLLNEQATAGYFMVPGVKSEDGQTVWTEDNEILLGGVASNDYMMSRFVLNLETGERKPINADEARYDLNLVRCNEYLQTRIGDHFITYDSSARKNIKTKERDSSVAQGNYYDSVFELDGYIYSAYSFNYDRHEITLYAYNKETLSRESEHDKTITIPSTFERPRIFKYKENYILTDAYYNISSSSQKGSVYIKAKSVVFSNIDDIENSIIEVMPAVQALNFAVINDKPYFFTSDNSLSQSSQSDATLDYEYINPSNSLKQCTKYGIKYTTEGMYGNLFSFKTFDSPQQIPEGEGVKLQYYYTFEQ